MSTDSFSNGLLNFHMCLLAHNLSTLGATDVKPLPPPPRIPRISDSATPTPPPAKSLLDGFLPGTRINLEVGFFCFGDNFIL